MCELRYLQESLVHVHDRLIRCIGRCLVDDVFVYSGQRIRFHDAVFSGKGLPDVLLFGDDPSGRLECPNTAHASDKQRFVRLTLATREL